MNNKTTSDYANKNQTEILVLDILKSTQNSKFIQ